MPGLAPLQFTKEVFLRPIEVRLLVHFRAAFPRRHCERTDMDAVGFGALQQRHMLERRRHRLKHRHQVAQHQIVGSYLAFIAPALHQVRRLIERCVDKVGCALQLRSAAGALSGIGQVYRNVAGAMEIAWLSARQRDHLASARAAEVPQGRVSHQPGRARDDDLLVRHVQRVPVNLTARRHPTRRRACRNIW